MTGGLDETALEELWARTLPPGSVAGGDPTLSMRPVGVLPGAVTASVASASPGAATVVVPQPVAPAASTVAPRASPGVGPPAPASTPEVFQVGGGYDVLGELGRGGMGIVYRARQPGLDREVALKRVLPERATSENEVRFVAEARTTGFLDHPNIVPVHAFDRTAGGELYLAMKLVGGVRWCDLLHPRTPAHEALAKEHDLARHLGVLLAVANAVAFAHSRGIIHRDLKPENVMVGEFGEVLVMDWGLAVDVSAVPPSPERAPHRSRLGPTVAGTPCYMAPEMAEGRSRDLAPTTDVYLLGAILHEVLTGRAPHSGKSVLSVLRIASRSEPPAFGPEVPAELALVCRRALAREARERFASVLELKAAILGYLAHRESTRISDEAERSLAASDRRAASGAGFESDSHVLYGELADALSAMRQALVLWPGNEPARAGERRARLVYARVALDRGDLGLAGTLVEPLVADDGAAVELRGRLVEARARKRRFDRYRQLMVALVCVLVLVVAGASGVILVSNQRARAARERAEEAEQRALAAAARERAERERAQGLERDARESATSARVERDRAQQALAHTFEVRGQAALAEEDLAVAATLFAAANELAPSYLARANVAFCLERVARLESLEDGTPGTFARDDGGALVLTRDDRWPFSGEAKLALVSPDGRHVLSLTTSTPVRATVRSMPGDEVIGRTGSLDVPVTTDLTVMGVSSEDFLLNLNEPVVGFSEDGSELFFRGADPHRLQRRRIEGWVELPPIDLTALHGLGGFDMMAGVTTVDAGSTLLFGSRWSLIEAKLPSGPLRRVHELEPGPFITKLAIIPRGGDELAIALSNGVVQFFDLEAGRAVSRNVRHRDRILDWDCAPRGARWVTASRDGTARVWSLPGSRPTPFVVRVAGGARSARLSGDGTRLGVASSLGPASTWALQMKAGHKLTWPRNTLIQGLTLIPRTGRILARGYERSCLYDPETGKAAKAFEGMTGATVLARSPEGQIAFVHSGSVVVCDEATGAERTRLAVGAGQLEVACLTSGRWLVRDRHVRARARIYDPREQTLVELPSPAAAVALPVLLVGEDGALRARDAATGDVLAEARGEPLRWLEVTGDGKHVACLEESGHATVRSVPGLAVEATFDAGTDATLAFTEGDRTILVLAWGGARASFDRVTGQKLTAPPGGEIVLAKLCSPSRRRMLVPGDGPCRLWDSVASRWCPEPLMSANVVGFSSDEARVALGGRSTARIYDASTGLPVTGELALPGAADEVRFVADDRALVVLCRRVGEVIFDTLTGARIGVSRTPAEGAHGTNDIEAAAEALLPQFSVWDPEARRLVTASAQKGRVQSLGFLFPGESSPGELTRQVRRVTGLSLDERGEVRVLTAEEWRTLAP